MKNTRRFISAVMALVMAAGSAMYVSAEDAQENQNTNLLYTVDPSYAVTIPASITLSDTSTTSASISVDENAKPFKLSDGQTLSVNIADVETNDFKVKCGTVEVPYTVTAGTSTTALEKGSTAAAFTNDDKTAKTLTFSQIDSTLATVAGEYTGTLTFGIELEDASTPVTPVTITWDNTNVFTDTNENEIFDNWNKGPFTFEDVSISFTGSGANSSFCLYGGMGESSLDVFESTGGQFTFTAPSGKQFTKIEITDNSFANFTAYGDWTKNGNKQAVWSGTPSNTVTLGRGSGYSNSYIFNDLKSIVFTIEPTN